MASTLCNFVLRRQIIDIIIVQEMLHTMRRKHGQVRVVAIKIDPEKAYD